MSNVTSFVKKAGVNTREVQESVLGGRDRYDGLKKAIIIASDEDLQAITEKETAIREVSKEFKGDIVAEEYFREELGGAKAVKAAIINQTLANPEINKEVEDKALAYSVETFGGFSKSYF